MSLSIHHSLTRYTLALHVYFTELNCTCVATVGVNTVLESASYPVEVLLLVMSGGAGVCDGGGDGVAAPLSLPLPPFIPRARFTCELFPSIF